MAGYPRSAVGTLGVEPDLTTHHGSAARYVYDTYLYYNRTSSVRTHICYAIRFPYNNNEMEFNAQKVFVIYIGTYTARGMTRLDQNEPFSK